MSEPSLSLSCPSLLCLSKHQEYMDSLVPPSRDQFERIAHVQAAREEEIKRRIRQQKRWSNHERRQSHHSDSHHERAHAARVIQKTFRGYRARREMSGFTLDPASRWIAAVHEMQFRQAMQPRTRSLTSLSRYSVDTESTAEAEDVRSSTARLKWKKVGMIARRAGHVDTDRDSDTDDSSWGSDGLSPHGAEEKEEMRKLRREANAQRRQTALTLGLQYWLEIVDSKHRYGTNLRMYHEEWRKAKTNENFFYWLDHGEGRYISLQTCSRQRLELDQVRYLSREERQYYLATVDDLGRICWAKNGEPIDTSDRYRDSLYGIVPVDDPAPTYHSTKNTGAEDERMSDDRHSATSTSITDIGNEHEHRHEHRPAATEQDGQEQQQKQVKKVVQISATTTFNKLLRKMVKDGTWIFVADTSFRLYVGIKEAGAFQHSSFLQGGRISAGGVIGIRNGQLTSLSPLSGHYRPPTSNFRAFVRSLEAEGVDVTHAPIFKSYAVLYGLETYVKARHKGRELMHMMGRRRHDNVARPAEAKRPKEEDGEEQEPKTDRPRLSSRGLRKLHVRPFHRDNGSKEGGHG